MRKWYTLNRGAHLRSRRASVSVVTSSIRDGSEAVDVLRRPQVPFAPGQVGDTGRPRGDLPRALDVFGSECTGIRVHPLRAHLISERTIDLVVGDEDGTAQRGQQAPCRCCACGGTEARSTATR